LCRCSSSEISKEARSEESKAAEHERDSSHPSDAARLDRSAVQFRRLEAVAVWMPARRRPVLSVVHALLEIGWRRVVRRRRPSKQAAVFLFNVGSAAAIQCVASVRTSAVVAAEVGVLIGDAAHWATVSSGFSTCRVVRHGALRGFRISLVPNLNAGKGKVFQNSKFLFFEI
jgi:hypothetical protein